ncbi:MAG: hypothetical protein Q9M97_00055 [Candidatus Gracilibacteria bacterium]|nr:hypothetical protein [Candidatus Gracilibacteria bacterium]
MFEELKQNYVELDKTFSTQVDKKINDTPDNFFNREERAFLMNLKDGTKIFFNEIDKKEKNPEINYKLKIDALVKLNKTLQNYPVLKTKQKLDAFNILEVISSDLKLLKADIITGNKAILQDEFLKDADFPGVDHISDKIEEADSWDIKTLIEETKNIEIESQNITSKDFDNFIDDLDIPSDSSEKTKFESAIKKFKKSKIYNESKSENITSNIGLDTNGLNIKSIGTEIDNIIDDIIEKDKKSGNNLKNRVKYGMTGLNF